MKSFSIVIPTYNHYDLLHARLFEIYQKCSPVLEVVVVDDCSTDQDYAEGIEWWKTNGMLNIRHLRMNKNGGFILSSNAGIQRAVGDIVCLLSSDVKIGSDIVTSISNLLKIGNRTLVGGRLLDWDTGWNVFGGEVFPYLEGWLLAATKENWKLLDYLDTDLVPCDFEDVSLSTKALQNDFHLVPLNDGRIVHIGGQTIGYNPEREIITHRNRETFRQKYVK
jgi:GT2 family glycosyltransferase